MSLNAVLACLAAWAQLQGCPSANQKEDLLATAQPPAQTYPAQAQSVQAHPVRGNAPVVVLAEDAAPVARFSGFYLGGSAGWGTVHSDQVLNRNNNHGADSVSPDGFVASLAAGYNLPLGGLLIAGVEADIGIMNIGGDDKPVFDGHSWKPAFGPLWGSLRGRIGMPLMDSLLIYGTAGVAFMQTDNWTLGNNFNESSWDAKTRTGWVAGVGVEYALNERWSAKAEYLYMDFGRHRGYTEDNDPYHFDDSMHLLRMGVNYRF